ncbi:hypothetical protein K3177_05595 [Qipengyuania sp. GH25]|uniref:Uncharacterized protein n=1 Tax=Qipengyuania pacifica TaxID=2860199 RepID=A0ABS7JD75_9SPHN|nr:hypothetical protein [Qipengyuania aerophila]MBX7487979.1 hypothetical protein [Qipengyuania aerophila]
MAHVDEGLPKLILQSVDLSGEFARMLKAVIGCGYLVRRLHIAVFPLPWSLVKRLLVVVCAFDAKAKGVESVWRRDQQMLYAKKNHRFQCVIMVGERFDPRIALGRNPRFSRASNNRPPLV